MRDAIAGNMRCSRLNRLDIARLGSDHDTQFDFPIGLFARARDQHLVIRPNDGIRCFLEVGPGTSCTRMIGQILRGRPHVAISACRPDRDPLAAILDVLAELISQRLPVNLAGLYRERVISSAGGSNTLREGEPKYEPSFQPAARS